MVEITVCGEAVERASAERATVTVQSRWSADTAEEALRVVSRAHAGVVDDARTHEEAGRAESWRADRVWLSHHHEWVGDDKARRLVHTANATVTITFTDFEALGTWIGQLGVEDAHEVGQIAWSLSEQTERERGRAARSRAVADALERAGDYAAAAGLGTPAVSAIREPGTTPPQPMPHAARMAAYTVGGAPESLAVELEAGEIEVHAEVEVTCVAEPQRHIA